MAVRAKNMPTIKSGTVEFSILASDAAKCPREYLTPHEVDELMTVAKQRGRHGHRDATMILMAYRHGLRVSELCALRWDQVDLKAGFLHVHRLKRGIPSVHPLRGPELRALRQLRRESQPSPYLYGRLPKSVGNVENSLISTNGFLVPHAEYRP